MPGKLTVVLKRLNKQIIGESEGAIKDSHETPRIRSELCISLCQHYQKQRLTQPTRNIKHGHIQVRQCMMCYSYSHPVSKQGY